MKLFWFFFYNFGLFAWGRPVAQIALIKERLVIQDKWITLPRFQRVFSVYQILPGPEAAELCMFFGCLSAGRIGGIIAGLAFILPGFALMLLASYFFISLGLYGIIYAFISRRLWIPAAALFILQYIGYALYVVFRGVPSPVSLALGIARTPSLINLFVLGLVAGTLSFGGAYTAIPFVQVEAVLMGAWLPQRVFVDGIAIGNILPAPLVIFATFVGFQGHKLLEKLVRNKFLSSFFDGLCGSVVGVIAIIAVQILKTSIEGSLDKVKDKPVDEVTRITAEIGPAAVLYMLSLAVLYKFTNKYTALLLVIIGAVTGQFLFVD
ncbi:hypothetical protein Trco_006999 [Trichoderma cornu-damae]|uniref:Chromate transporter n=1 Tax=Trichoderma cornu-damae TaxID=654480 RepID=A0A9P8QMX7_9HYPO|nr:hypothetical protein Trco_006999 [Trichoderma cornu-damae]